MAINAAPVPLIKTTVVIFVGRSVCPSAKCNVVRFSFVDGGFGGGVLFREHYEYVFGGFVGACIYWFDGGGEGEIEMLVI